MNPLNHVAIIMDGNGRWGIKYKNSRNAGHKAGLNTVEKIIKETIKNKIKFLTLYAFSTENWKRPKTEINFLFKLISSYFNKEIKNVIKNNIKINILGKKTSLPNYVKKILISTINKTKNNNKLVVNLALNYGSKSEIVQTINQLKNNKKNISEIDINKNLYTKGMPNPDILIRTGGQRRLSNFMLWQLAYAELYFLDKLWPDFNENDFKKIIKDYYKIRRNFGGI